MSNRLLVSRWAAIILLGLTSLLHGETRPVREVLEDLVLLDREDPTGLLEELEKTGDPFVKEFVNAWRTGEVYLDETNAEEPVVLQRVSEQYRELTSNTPVVYEGQSEQVLSKARPSRKLRKLLLRITDTIDLSSPDRQVRIEAVRKLGLSGKDEYQAILQQRYEVEESSKVRGVLEEMLLLNTLNKSEESAKVMEAVVGLGKLKSLSARKPIGELSERAVLDGNKELHRACVEALRMIDNYQLWVDQLGNLFRGMSLGSVLLMVSFGLAITFGLMGIINMAHGEFIAIGGYGCFLVQNLFASVFGVQSSAYQWFFITSLLVSFLAAALIGLFCEKTFIRFLYRRPLESLLATWGLSMVMQQVFRLIFGAANVQVNTPDYLQGSLDFAGASLSYTRLFVIIFAIVIVVATWLLLTRTNLGLYIRAVMQNRQMAASLGIPVDKVNSLTFAFGCGLASLAGVVLSQLGNVGPSMGQAYIVDCFMVVVAGSVGNLMGAGISAMGIGLVDQFLQPTLGPVMGKITVFVVIILFLQWKPGGLFPAKSRSLED